MTLADRWRERRMRQRTLERVAILQTMTDGRRWYGYDLSRAVNIRAGRMYPALTQLYTWGYVSDGWEPTADIEELRPPRRWYRITSAGWSAATHPVDEWRPFPPSGPGGPRNLRWKAE